jgi:hypothetical protein
MPWELSLATLMGEHVERGGGGWQSASYKMPPDGRLADTPPMHRGARKESERVRKCKVLRDAAGADGGTNS